MTSHCLSISNDASLNGPRLFVNLTKGKATQHLLEVAFLTLIFQQQKSSKLKTTPSTFFPFQGRLFPGQPLQEATACGLCGAAGHTGPPPVPHLSSTCPSPVLHLSSTCPSPVIHLSFTCPPPVPNCSPTGLDMPSNCPPAVLQLSSTKTYANIGNTVLWSFTSPPPVLPKLHLSLSCPTTVL